MSPTRAELIDALTSALAVAGIVNGTETKEYERAQDVLRAALTASETVSGDAELKLLRRACDAAFAFIDSHAADPDLTDEMCLKHADYLEARRALEATK